MKKILATALVLCSLFYSLQAKAASSLAHAKGLFTYPAMNCSNFSSSCFFFQFLDFIDFF